MWLAVAKHDVEDALQALHAWSEQELEAAIPDREIRMRATSVVDLDAESSQCPACSGTVPKDAVRCPSCRLRFA